jgi:hypothetical protein
VLEQPQQQPSKSTLEERPTVAAGATPAAAASAGTPAARRLTGSGAPGDPPGAIRGAGVMRAVELSDWASGATAPVDRVDPLAFALARAVSMQRRGDALGGRTPPRSPTRNAREPAAGRGDRLLMRRSLGDDGGVPVNTIGVVDWDGTPELRLRSSPATEPNNVIGQLPFSTRVQVMARLPGKWYRVSTIDGLVGYVASEYVRTDLPEPLAGRHRVEKGAKGTVIAIAEHYYGAKAKDWGQDLRFYVNVLAWANRKPVPDGVDGWRSVAFEAGEKIWIPSQPFAYSLRGVLSSGSLSYEALDAVGLATVMERIGQLTDDLVAAIARSKEHMGDAIKFHVEEALWSAVTSLAIMMVGAVALMAVMSAIGGAVGGPAGAAAGFQLSLLLLKFLGLAFLVKWIVDAVTKIASAFGRFLMSVWDARGDEKKLDGAGWDFADAIGTLMGTVVEALVLWAASVGIGVAIGKLRNTTLGRSLGEAFFEWMGKAEPAKLRRDRLAREAQARARREELVRRRDAELRRRQEAELAAAQAAEAARQQAEAAARQAREEAAARAAAEAQRNATPPPPQTDPVGTKFPKGDLLSASRALDPADGGKIRTKAGRALQKHGSRGGAFPKATGRPAEMNAQAERIVEEILNDPGSTEVFRHHAKLGWILDITSPSGRGLRFSGSGEFIGLLEPPP